MAFTKACINLDIRQLEELKKLSATTGAPVSELVRRAIGEYLQKKQAFIVAARAALQKKGA